jgi:hypothetical protein
MRRQKAMQHNLWVLAPNELLALVLVLVMVLVLVLVLVMALLMVLLLVRRR